MSGVITLGLEVLASLALSALVLARLQGRLRRIGNETCDRERGSDFWIAYTQLMMVIAPLLVIAAFSRAGSPVVVSIAQELKSSLLLLLCGQFAGLVLVGRAVWKIVDRGAATASVAAGRAAS